MLSPSLIRALELARRGLRRVLPRRVILGLSHAIDSYYSVRKIGLREFLAMRRLLPEVHPPSGALVHVQVKGIRHPVAVRPGTTDISELIHTCVREVYGKFLPPGQVKLIIDAGANIGDTTVWYLNRFPEATVIAIEPDQNNFSVLVENCKPYGDRAVPLRAAVWPGDDKILHIVDSTMASGISVSAGSEASAMSCPAVSMNELLTLAKIQPVDIFKCDIEGAELQLFGQGSDQWLPAVRSIAIELHSPECEQVVFSATSKLGFSRHRYRDIYILER